MSASDPHSAAARRARVLAVTSGSGGVGKTFLAANLAAALVRLGERVLVLDADLGLANLETVLDLARRRTLHDVFVGAARLEDAIVAAPGGFEVVLAGPGLLESAHRVPDLRRQLAAAVDTFAGRCDRLLVHTGAGVSEVVQHAVSLAGEVLVVVTAEATAMTEAYSAIKVLALRQQRSRLRLVVNHAVRAGEGHAVCCQLQRVVDRFVTPEAAAPVTLECLGEVPADAAVTDALRQRRLLLAAAPGSPAARAVGAIALRLAGG